MNNQKQSGFHDFIHRVTQQLGWRIIEEPNSSNAIVSFPVGGQEHTVLLKAKSQSVIGIYSLPIRSGLNDSDPKVREMGKDVIQGFLLGVRNKELEDEGEICRWRLIEVSGRKELSVYQEIDVNGLTVEDFKKAVMTVADEEYESTLVFKGAADKLRKESDRR